ncbi:MAG TPA: M20/M25/M40 family metallo-hydrolase [Candidatus Eisenbacteria bacterium]|nr:M20/M25/M40 family metallo-hydrolase [Candidatus Eisenbacteria bacterium]
MHSDPLAPESIAALAGDLIRIPSVNPAIAPDEAHGEQAVASFACEWLAARGIKAWLEEAAPGRPNAVAEVIGGPGPTLVLCAHLDTVGTAGMTIPAFEPGLRDGRLYGRGSYDMKGAAAACMSAAAALQGSSFPGRVMLALVADEEHASLGAMDFVRRHRADGCILTEASAGALVLAHKGFVWAEIVTRGRAAHGSRWDLGVSAIGSMGRIISALERFDQETLRARTHDLVGPASMHCALVQGGSGLSTYAPECRLSIERRTLPGESPAQVLAELEAVVAQAGETAEITPLLDRPPLTVAPDSAIARCVRDAATQVTGSPPAVEGVGYWMDAAIFDQAGIPTVNFGPDGAGAHEAVEWVDLASLTTCARVLEACGREFARYAAPPHP